MASAGYPLGFIICPFIVYPGWERDYGNLMEELISHRFTARAKKEFWTDSPPPPSNWLTLF